jgi:hypothetical protein
MLASAHWPKHPSPRWSSEDKKVTQAPGGWRTDLHLGIENSETWPADRRDARRDERREDRRDLRSTHELSPSRDIHPHGLDGEDATGKVRSSFSIPRATMIGILALFEMKVVSTKQTEPGTER